MQYVRVNSVNGIMLSTEVGNIRAVGNTNWQAGMYCWTDGKIALGHENKRGIDSGVITVPLTETIPIFTNVNRGNDYYGYELYKANKNKIESTNSIYKNYYKNVSAEFMFANSSSAMYGVTSSREENDYDSDKHIVYNVLTDEKILEFGRRDKGLLTRISGLNVDKDNNVYTCENGQYWSVNSRTRNPQTSKISVTGNLTISDIIKIPTGDIGYNVTFVCSGSLNIQGKSYTVDGSCLCVEKDVVARIGYGGISTCQYYSDDSGTPINVDNGLFIYDNSQPSLQQYGDAWVSYMFDVSFTLPNKSKYSDLIGESVVITEAKKQDMTGISANHDVGGAPAQIHKNSDVFKKIDLGQFAQKANPAIHTNYERINKYAYCELLCSNEKGNYYGRLSYGGSCTDIILLQRNQLFNCGYVEYYHYDGNNDYYAGFIVDGKFYEDNKSANFTLYLNDGYYCDVDFFNQSSFTNKLKYYDEYNNLIYEDEWFLGRISVAKLANNTYLITNYNRYMLIKNGVKIQEIGNGYSGSSQAMPLKKQYWNLLMQKVSKQEEAT